MLCIMVVKLPSLANGFFHCGDKDICSFGERVLMTVAHMTSDPTRMPLLALHQMFQSCLYHCFAAGIEIRIERR